MRVLLLVTVLGIASLACAADTLTQADLLYRIVDLDRLTTPPAERELTAMFSSYDRAARIDEHGRYINWDANADRGQFMRHTEDGWDVMAEIHAPGVLTRIWSANPEGDIRFVLDGENVIDVPFADLMSGKLAPFNAPFVYRGLNCYFPIGFNESCLVLCRNSTSYYQINCVAFPAGTQVQRFSFELDEAATAARDAVAKILTDGYPDDPHASGRRTMPVAAYKDLRDGDKLEESLGGAGTIRALYVALTDRVDPRDLYALHECVLRIWFDGEKRPSVEVPLIDFFGCGFEPVRFDSLVAGTDKALEVPLPDRRMSQARFYYNLFPMPYQKGWQLEIANETGSRKPIGLLLYMRVETRAPAENALRFHARYRMEDPADELDYPILEAQGPGRVVGVVLNVDCPRADWWGEGDDKVWIDGATFPRYFGTGSEDYLNDAWGLHAYIAALGGVTRTAAYGKNSAYRWHIPDTINFQRDVRFTIENWQHGHQWDTYYSTVAFWYAAAGAQDFFTAVKPADLKVPGLRIPGAIELEGNVTGNDWGHELAGDNLTGVELSNGTGVVITSTEPVTVNIPSTNERVALLKLRAVPRRSFETITVTAPDGRTIGTVQYTRRDDAIYRVGIVQLHAGNNPFKLQCSAPATLDCWILDPVPTNARGPEAETLPVETPEGVKTATEFARLNWSGGGQRVVHFGKVGQRATFRLHPLPTPAPVALVLQLTQSPQGGKFRVYVNDTALSGTIDTYGAEAQIVREYLGAVAFDPNAPTVTFESLEPNPAATGMDLGVDALDVMPTFSRNAVEAECLPVAAEHGAHLEVQGIGGAGGGEHLWCRATEPGASVTLTVPLPKPGRYHVTVVYTTSFDYGIVQASVDGAQVGEPVDTYTPQIVAGKRVELGTFAFAAPQFALQVEVVGHNDASPGYFFGIDSVIVDPAE